MKVLESLRQIHADVSTLVFTASSTSPPRLSLAKLCLLNQATGCALINSTLCLLCCSNRFRLNPLCIGRFQLKTYSLSFSLSPPFPSPSSFYLCSTPQIIKEVDKLRQSIQLEQAEVKNIKAGITADLATLTQAAGSAQIWTAMETAPAMQELQRASE